MLINSHREQSLSAHLYFLYFLYFFLSIYLFPFFLFSSPLHLYQLLLYSLLLFILLFHHPVFSHSPLSHLSPIFLSLSLSLAVDYFWAAWLISVGSQAQCQGKWNAYKEAKRQTETSKSLSSFFSLSARRCSEALSLISVGVCVCVCVCFESFLFVAK